MISLVDLVCGLNVCSSQLAALREYPSKMGGGARWALAQDSALKGPW